jgi:hypothetical protein
VLHWCIRCPSSPNQPAVPQMRILTGLLALLLAAPALPLTAQRVTLDRVTVTDTTLRHEVRLRDGSTLIGRITSLTADSVYLALGSGPLVVARSSVTEVRQFASSQLRGGVPWFENPHPTRLLFAPTAFALSKGERYYSNIYLFFNSFAVGVTDRFTMGAGMTLFPAPDMSDNLFYLTPKYTFAEGDNTRFAVGGFLGWFGAASDAEGRGSLGILYATGSAGTVERNVTVGMGWGYLGGDIADRPLVMVGFQSRVAQRLALVSENWIFPSSELAALVSFGLRFLGERIGADVALINNPSDPVTLGVPFVGLTIKF